MGSELGHEFLFVGGEERLSARGAEFLEGEVDGIFFKVFIDVEEVVGVEFVGLGLGFVFGAVEGGVHKLFDGVHGK